jgi:hypothetical protein
MAKTPWQLGEPSKELREVEAANVLQRRKRGE